MGAAAAGIAAAWLLAGCGVLTTDEQLLQRFFEASRVYDRGALEKVAAPGVAYNPVTDGVVGDFIVTEVINQEARRTVRVDAEVRAVSGVRRQLMRAVIEREHGQWRITSLTPLPASQSAP